MTSGILLHFTSLVSSKFCIQHRESRRKLRGRVSTLSATGLFRAPPTRPNGEEGGCRVGEDPNTGCNRG